jgi:diaminopimelate epimerase
MKTLKFTKWQGIGNDFILIDSRTQDLEGINLKNLAIQMCDRHYGIGADGLLIVWPSQKADFRMQIFNPDGSEPEMCGNGIRCFTSYIYQAAKEEERKDIWSVETKAGIMVPAVIKDDGEIKGIEVDMGIPQAQAEVELEGYKFYKVSMGNPHAVAFVDDIEKAAFYRVGPKVETNSHFPSGTNVEFVKINNRSNVTVKVWERGAGETLACGTGACAVVAAAVLNNLTDRKVLVHLPGGELEVEWESEDNHIVMRGPAEKVFEGQFPIT